MLRPIFSAYWPPRPFSYYPFANENTPSLSTRIDQMNMLPMNGHGLEGSADFVLECHNLSYIRSFTTGKWISKVFNPPITAQFLKDVNLEVHGGEIMGVIGAGGSGKTTLLNVIARRVQGTTGGTILLNHRPMTERTFQNNCAYVTFKQNLITCLTLKETLRYQAELALAPALSSKEKSERIHHVMRDFELMDYGRRKVKDLSESARRRLILAMQLVRDPLLLLIDEPCKEMDALSSYQLMYDLFQYMKRYNRMAMVTTMMPRSDIYQLFDRLTILFFGETVYSGYTKQMPLYFRQIGYPCPATENPAVYYLSLATVDRETTERYMETQDQAVKLIEIFKGQGEPFSQYRGPSSDVHNSSISPYLPLSHLGRPGVLSKLTTLIGRNYKTMFGQNGKTLITRMVAFPFFALIFWLLYGGLLFGGVSERSESGPQTRAGLIFCSICAVSLLSTVLTTVSTAIHRNRYYQESWDYLYGGTTYIMAQLITQFLPDIIGVFGGSAIIFWLCKLDGNIVDYCVFAAVLWCCFQFGHLQTLLLMLVVRSAYKTATISATLLILYIALYSGFLKAYTTYANSTDWLYYLSFAALYRYAGLTLNYQQISKMNTTCARPGQNSEHINPQQFCRWEDGMRYLNEIYPEHSFDNFWLNFGICFAFVFGATLITVFLYAAPLPYLVKRKFRFK